MKLSKKHLILGIICLISAILQNISGISIFIPYLAFCLCSFFTVTEEKKVFKFIIILLLGFVGVPLFEFIYSMLTAMFMKTLPAFILISLVQTCFYFGLFIIANCLMRKERFYFSSATVILAILCVAVYSVLEGLQYFVFFHALNQAVEQSSLVGWLSVMESGNIMVSLVSGLVFYIALWCISVSFIREK